MFDHFTDFSRMAVVAAVGEAERLHHPIVGSEHLLLALSKQPGLAAVALRRWDMTPQDIDSQVALRSRYVPEADALSAIGIDLSEFVRKTEETFGRGSLEQKPQITELLNAVFERALEEAAELGSTYEGSVFVGTEHLLLGLLRQGEGVGCQILLAHDVDLERARAELRRLVATCTTARASVDRQVTEQSARRVLQTFGQLDAADRESVSPVVREMHEARGAAWSRVLEGIEERSTDELVADYVATVAPFVERAESAVGAR